MAHFKNTTLPPERLTEQDLRVRLPLKLEWLGSDVRLGKGKRADARIRLTRRDDSQTFLVEYRKNWTGASLNGAIEQAKNLVQYSPGDLPMVVLPYLSRELLETLMNAGVSGLDLLGNGYVDTAEWGVWLEGQPNPFKNTQVIKSPYQGKSALVARTLLSCPVLPNAEALRSEIEKRGGKVSQPVVSRALKAFRDDLIVGSEADYGIVLLQPEKLLDRLTEQWKVTTERWQQGPTVLWRGKVDGDIDEVRKAIVAQAKALQRPIVRSWTDLTTMSSPVTTSGVSSYYATMANGLLDTVVAEETRRFPNLEILSAPDESVFFDVACSDRDCLSSRLQLYLEMAVGDVRAQSAAEVIRKEILEDLEKSLDDVGIWL